MFTMMTHILTISVMKKISVMLNMMWYFYSRIFMMSFLGGNGIFVFWYLSQVSIQIMTDADSLNLLKCIDGTCPWAIIFMTLTHPMANAEIIQGEPIWQALSSSFWRPMIIVSLRSDKYLQKPQCFLITNVYWYDICIGIKTLKRCIIRESYFGLRPFVITLCSIW